MKKFEDKYPSRHKPDKLVTVGQWLGELMCERHAQQTHKELPRSFWTVDKQDNHQYKYWYDYLRRQVAAAYKLIKEHGEEKVLKAVKNKPNLYSLSPKWVKEYVSNTRVPIRKQVTEIERPVVDDKVRAQQKHASILSLLGEI